MITVSPAEKLTDSLASQLQQLMPQLKENSSTNLINAQKLIDDNDSDVLIAEEDGVIVGVAIVDLSRKFVKTEARINDVVVDRSSRGKGVGTTLMQAAIDWAWQKGAEVIELTTNPKRETANHLYKKLGFTLYETNVYQLKRN